MCPDSGAPAEACAGICSECKRVPPWETGRGCARLASPESTELSRGNLRACLKRRAFRLFSQKAPLQGGQSCDCGVLSLRPGCAVPPPRFEEAVAFFLHLRKYASFSLFSETLGKKSNIPIKNRDTGERKAVCPPARLQEGLGVVTSPGDLGAFLVPR